MDKSTVVALRGKEEVVDPLTELLRVKGQALLAAAVQAEAAAFLEQYAERRDVQGRRAVVRNGYQPRREILTGIGPLAVAVPKSRDRSGQGLLFRSHLVPPYVRKARRVEALLPWLYLKGVSSGDMQEALTALLGAQARGLSPAVIGRLKAQWSVEHAAWQKRDLSGQRWVYVWADGIYSGLRAEDERLCLLVVIGVNERGQKHFLAIEDGMRESAESWKLLLRDLKERGVHAPKLAIGDGALGFWAALREVFAKTREQRCWVHKAANVLNYLPKSLQAKANAGVREIWMAASKAQAERAFEQFVLTYQTKYPKATACLQKDRAALLAFYDFPAEHWKHIRTANPIESSFATIRHRPDQTNGAVSRASLLGLVYKLAMCAEQSFRRLDGFELLAEVIVGVQFKDGVRQRSDEFEQAAA